MVDFFSADFDIVYSPTFIDVREIPEVDLAIVEGGVRTEADENLIRQVRAKSKTLVALGICATHGGITSLGNLTAVKKNTGEEVLASSVNQASRTHRPDVSNMQLR